MALVISVTADGFLGNVQKKIFGSHSNATAEELTFGTALSAAAILFTWLFLTSSFGSSVAAVSVTPLALTQYSI
jgi:hypothetical protein